jgi:hypothetical protein
MLITSEVIFEHLKKSFDYVVQEMEDVYHNHHVWIDKTIEQLKKNLDEYIQTLMDKELIEVEKCVDGKIKSEFVEKIVNEWMEEIVKKIEEYIHDKLKN